jgi:hypothetical protein
MQPSQLGRPHELHTRRKGGNPTGRFDEKYECSYHCLLTWRVTFHSRNTTQSLSKKPATHYSRGHFSLKRLLKKKSPKNIPGAFLRTPGGLRPQNQSVTFDNPVTPPPPPGGGLCSGPSNGMSPMHKHPNRLVLWSADK